MKFACSVVGGESIWQIEMRGASPTTSRTKRAYYPTDDDQSIASYSSSAHVSGTITPTSSYSTRRGGRATTPNSAKSRYSYKSRLNGLDAASVSMMPDSILEKVGAVSPHYPEFQTIAPSWILLTLLNMHESQ
jgi:hypothetical protein